MAISSNLISQSYTDGASPALLQTYRLTSSTALDVSKAADVASALGAVNAGGVYYLMAYTTLADSNLYGRLRMRSANVVPVANSSGKIVDVQVRWDSMYQWGSPSGISATLYLPVEVDFDASPRAVTMYRTTSSSGTWGTSPSAGLSTTTDIGGTKLDYASRPVNGSVPAVTVRVSMIIDSQRFALTAIYDHINSAIGRWNSTTFLHWSAEQVYCESASISHIRDEYYRATYVFKWDRWYGCEQIPKTDKFGRPSVDSNGNSITVTWKSQEKLTYDHNSIFNDQPNSTLAKQIALEGSWLTYP